MDLVQSIRKQGSRGGRNEFSWDDVKNSQHRENYLGHSVMAPVGRWQKNKDLTWYAKNDDGTERSEAEARKEEMRRVKQAEDDAMARALGYEVPDRGEDNPNTVPLGNDKELQKTIKESAKEDASTEDGGRGLGYGKYGASESHVGGEMIKGVERGKGGLDHDERPTGESRTREKRRDEDRHKREKIRYRSRSRSRDRDRHRRHSHTYHAEHRKKDTDRDNDVLRRRDSERNHDERRRQRHRSRSRSRSRERRLHRSRSPRHDHERDRYRARSERHHERYDERRSHDRRDQASPYQRHRDTDRRRNSRTDNY